jgi:hypothetical protein
MVMAASFVCFMIGIGDIVWGFWGDFVSKGGGPSIASRLESGIIFLLLSYALYLVARRQKRKHLQG